MLYRKISTDIEAHLRSGTQALDKFLADKEYNIPSGIVLDNEREVYTKGNVTYMPIYYIMCIERAEIPEGDCIF